MKKVLLVIVGTLVLSGCGVPDKIDQDKSIEAAKSSCATAGGELQELYYQRLGNQPLKAVCSTLTNVSNKFVIYSPAVYNQ